MKRKINIGILFFVLIFLLSGCGAKISTTLNLKSDFSGERIITMTASRNDVDGKFKGGIQQVDKIFKTSCPSEFTYTKNDDPNNYVYILRLPFTSLEDYKQKAAKLVGRDVQINFSTPNTVFASGVSISEDFNSLDLLNWFKKAVQDGKTIDDVSQMWEIGDTKLDFNNKEYTTGDKINVNDITYNPLDKIVINTQENADGGFTRKIQYYIPNSTYTSKAADINVFMNSIVPKGDTGSWSPEADGNGQIFTIIFNSKDTNELNTKTAVALDSKNTLYNESVEKGKNPFSKSTVVSEDLDFSAFASDSESKVNVEYTFSIDQGSGKKLIAAQDRSGNYIGEVDSNTYSGSFHTNLLDLQLHSEQSFVVDSVDVKTAIKSDNQVSKEILFTFAPDTPSDGTSVAKKYFESLNISGLKASTGTDTGGRQTCDITINGATPDVNRALELLFGQGNSISYSIAKKSMASEQTVFSETLNIPSFLSSIGYGKDINYSLTANKGEKIQDLHLTGLTDNYSISEFKDVGNTFSKSISPMGQISYTGSKLLIWGLILTIAIWLIVISVIAFGIISVMKRLAVRDGLAEEKLITIVSHYTKIVRAKIVSYSGQISSQGILLNNDSARAPVIRYFHGSKWPVLLIVLTIIGIPGTIARAFHTRSSSTGMTFTIITLIAALVWYYYERFVGNPALEAKIDGFIEADIKGFKERALLKLGLLDEQVSLVTPINTFGPYYGYREPNIKRSQFYQVFMAILDLILYRTKLIFKYGSDGKIRYSLVNTQITMFTETQMYIYDIGYDLCTGEIFEESTTENFYQNIDCIEAGEKLQDIISFKKIVKKRFEFFKVIVSSGACYQAVIDTDQTTIHDQIMAMCNLVRERKDKYRRRRRLA